MSFQRPDPWCDHLNKILLRNDVRGVHGRTMEFRCQSCHVRLQLTGVEALRDVAASDAHAEPQAEDRAQRVGSAAAQPQPQPSRVASGTPASQMDESFVVLDDAQRNAMGHASAPGARNQMQQPVAVLQQAWPRR